MMIQIQDLSKSSISGRTNRTVATASSDLFATKHWRDCRHSIRVFSCDEHGPIPCRTRSCWRVIDVGYRSSWFRITEFLKVHQLCPKSALSTRCHIRMVKRLLESSRYGLLFLLWGKTIFFYWAGRSILSYMASFRETHKTRLWKWKWS